MEKWTNSEVQGLLSLYAMEELQHNFDASNRFIKIFKIYNNVSLTSGYPQTNDDVPGSWEILPNNKLGVPTCLGMSVAKIPSPIVL